MATIIAPPPVEDTRSTPSSQNVKYDVKDLSLAAEGRKRIEWAGASMPVLAQIREEFSKSQPLKGVRIAACLHVTTETANLMLALKDGGADIALCASNPLSTQDETAAALVAEYGISTFAINGVDNAGYYKHLQAAIDHKPHFTMDDGCDLVTLLHTKRQDALADVIAGTEETTTGVVRLRAMAKEGVLRYPVVAVNDALTKHMFDNRYGTGQSTMDGIIRCTNALIAGSTFVVAGYGWCGRGLAQRAAGMGAHVIVTEIDPTKALEAVMDGYRVMPMEEAAKVGDIFVTLTGNKDILRKEHFEVMKHGAMVANSGHFNVEIDIPALESLSTRRRTARKFVEEFTMQDGRTLCLLGEGRLINLTAAEGHPASVMDMSFANQALAAEYLMAEYKNLPKDVFPVPELLDKRVAKLKLASMGVDIDVLTAGQEAYLAGWSEGT